MYKKHKSCEYLYEYEIRLFLLLHEEYFETDCVWQTVVIVFCNTTKYRTLHKNKEPNHIWMDQNQWKNKKVLNKKRFSTNHKHNKAVKKKERTDKSKTHK